LAKDIKPETLEYLPVEQGNLRGLFTIKVGPCEFRKVRLVQQPGQAPFASPPQESYVGKDGQRRYITLVKWPHSWHKPILDALLEAQKDHPEGMRQVQAATALGREVQQRAGIGGCP